MVNHLSSIGCLFLLILLHYNGCSACFKPERLALLELKASVTKNATLSSFSPLFTWVDNQTSSDCCVWDGVMCDNTTNRIIQLNLGDGALGETPSLNTSLFLPFQHLQFLDLSSSGIAGWPINEGLEGFSKLRNLEYLNLAYNMLNETSLVSMDAITSLKELILYDNLIQHFPKGICELKKLEKLDLHDNQIAGVLHPCLLQNMTHLIDLDLSYNQLTGLIPQDQYDTTSLQFISHSQNRFGSNALVMSSFRPQLSSFILSNNNLNISTIHLLKFLHNQYNLTKIDLSDNSIHGNYPSWLVQNNTRLKFLLLSNNSFDGSIEFPFNSRKNMQRIDVSNNQISGQLQKNIGHIFPNLEELDLSVNFLEGRIPTSLGNMTNLFALFLSSNNFSGDLSPLSHLFNAATYLSDLDVSDNQFTRLFPINNVSLVDIKVLDISNNYITSSIPTWVANLTNLQSLNLGSNFFNGIFPYEFCNLRQLQFLDISENNLSGIIPPCLNLTSLFYMHLEHNKFGGPLPKAILNSMYLQTLHLSHNSFTGAIPKWLGLLPNLLLLVFKGNLLNSSVPQELCGLNKIVILDLSSNTLSGSVPRCLSDLAFGKFGPVEYYEVLDRIEQEAEFTTKSRSYTYKGKVLKYMAGMDLSSNHFTGEIPSEFEDLISIRSLNMSRNQFTGKIPKSLSNLKDLESIDLSYNKLSGEIPTELFRITTLAVFIVAYNNLSGRIPYMKAQFSTFNENSYQGNPFLCGPPLQSNCSSNKKSNISDPEDTAKSRGLWQKYGINPISFLASFVVAYIMYLTAFLAVLYINPHWRRLWFDFIDKSVSFIFSCCSEKVY